VRHAERGFNFRRAVLETLREIDPWRLLCVTLIEMPGVNVGQGCNDSKTTDARMVGSLVYHRTSGQSQQGVARKRVVRCSSSFAVSLSLAERRHCRRERRRGP